MKNVFKNKKPLLYKKNYTNYEKYFIYKIVQLEKIYELGSDHFLFGGVAFVSIVKNLVKIEKFNFPPNLCEIR